MMPTPHIYAIEKDMFYTTTPYALQNAQISALRTHLMERSEGVCEADGGDDPAEAFTTLPLWLCLPVACLSIFAGVEAIDSMTSALRSQERAGDGGAGTSERR